MARLHMVLKNVFKRWTAFEIDIIVSLALNHGELHFGDETSFQSHIVLFSEKKYPNGGVG